MAKKNYAKIIANGWVSIAAFAIAGLILALLISFIQPLRYSSTVRLLVLQDTGPSTDAFTASRSEELIAEKLSTIIFTTTFFNQVLNAGFDIERGQFPDDDFKRRQEWEDMLDATVSRGRGVLTIDAFHTNVDQAEQIALAVGSVLSQQANEYTSGGNVEVRMIDAPLNSRWPVKPNILVNGFSGLVLGGLAGTAYILFKAQKVQERHRLVHEEFK
jgi:capsular polysaccharide biosynthesis protein